MNKNEKIAQALEKAASHRRDAARFSENAAPMNAMVTLAYQLIVAREKIATCKCRPEGGPP